MSESTQPANNFAGFHVRQVPMTPEEEAKAKVAETMRNDIREFATGNDVSFLDRSPIIGAAAVGWRGLNRQAPVEN